MSAAPVVLVADDDRAIRTVLSAALTRAGYIVRAGGTAASLWNWVERGEGELVVLDVLLPDANGLVLIPRIRRLRPNLPVIAMSAEATLQTAVQAAEQGAFDYLPKPFGLDRLLTLAARALLPSAHPDAGEQPLGEPPSLVGQGAAMQELYRGIARLAATDLTVTIIGESGTGKELVARALHKYSGRAGPFVALNMAAIPRDLVESELFGHERGAFTGALTESPGRFRQAHGGTLFLDEIGDMPMEAQTRLLRVLQEKAFHTVGGRAAVHVDVRVIAATHRDLESLIDRNLFREDLFYRLNVAPLRVPPLRERAEDIPLLARHFLRLAESEGLPEKQLAPEAMTALERYRWPGNVRELENLMRRLAALSAGEVIGADAVAAVLSAGKPVAGGTSGRSGEPLEAVLERHFRALLTGDDLGTVYRQALSEFERPLIRTALGVARGNQIRAAAMLGLNRNTLRKKIRELAIPILRRTG